MKIKLIDENIKSYLEFLVTLLGSLQPFHLITILMGLIVVQTIGDIYILFVDREPLDLITIVALGGVFPGFLIIAFFCGLFVYKRYAPFHAIISNSSFEIVGYKKYFLHNLTSIEVYGPNILCITFNDHKVFYFISKNQLRNTALLEELKIFAQDSPIIFHKIGRDHGV